MAKVRTKKVKSQDVSELFKGMFGGEDDTVNVKIVWPKYQKMYHIVHEFVKLLDFFSSRAWLIQFFVDEHRVIVIFLEAMKKQFLEMFALEHFQQIFVGIPTDDEIKKFSQAYHRIKESVLVQTIIKTCSNLVPYKTHIANPPFSDRFLTRTAGLSFAPIPRLLAVNLKAFYNDRRMAPRQRGELLIWINKLYHNTYELYTALSMPDIDIDEFVDVVMSSLNDVKKSVPRCEQAFSKIAESVKLLKTNFADYYKDFVSTKNPTIIIENFVADVAKNTSASAVLTGQFRQIIIHYKKIASATQASNPKIHTLFQHIDKNITELENLSKETRVEPVIEVGKPEGNSKQNKKRRRQTRQAMEKELSDIEIK